MHRYALIPSVALALTIAACAHPAPPVTVVAAATAPGPEKPWRASPERFDKLVREDFFLGLKGDHEALDRGMTRCEEALGADPDNAGALVWHGVGLATRAGQALRAGRLPEAQELLGRAMIEAQRAIELRPYDIDIRVPHGALMLGLGATLPDSDAARARTSEGVRDYEAIVAAQRVQWPTLSVHGRGQLLYGLAEGWERLGDRDKARTYYQRIVAEVPGSPLAPRARAWLDGKPATDHVR